ncbi:prephenate dehydratase domain-containing protein [Gemmatirosa kalamazoonensis]|nr:prephenate dehydratase domain-containing protein [Gemmatirosa kalamazoonensis]
MDTPGPLRAVGAALGPRVAYQGEPGAFGEAAIAQRWEGHAVAVGATTFPRVIGLLLARQVDLAVLPTWNSTIGPILGAHELLYDNRTRVEVIDEVALPVHHAVLALPGASLASVRAVGSHHAALGQCARFFAEHPLVTAYEAFDTAGAARELAALVGGAPQGLTPPWYASVPQAAPETLAVIASEAAAQRHGLVVLASAVQDHADNETRFAVLRRHEGGRA